MFKGTYDLRIGSNNQSSRNLYHHQSMPSSSEGHSPNIKAVSYHRFNRHPTGVGLDQLNTAASKYLPYGTSLSLTIKIKIYRQPKQSRKSAAHQNGCLTSCKSQTPSIHATPCRKHYRTTKQRRSTGRGFGSEWPELATFKVCGNPFCKSCTRLISHQQRRI